MEELLRRWSSLILRNKVVTMVAVAGLALSTSGAMWWWKNQEPVKVEILGEENIATSSGEIWVDIQGAVEKPGAYRLKEDSRVKDVLLLAGGLASSADRSFVARYINLASRLSDGMKIYIPIEGEKTTVLGSSLSNNNEKSGVLNINTASQQQLEGLKGIGESRAKAIIDGRPYSSVDDLVSKKVISSSILTQIREEISVY